MRRDKWYVCSVWYSSPWYSSLFAAVPHLCRGVVVDDASVKGDCNRSSKVQLLGGKPGAVFHFNIPRAAQRDGKMTNNWDNMQVSAVD